MIKSKKTVQQLLSQNRAARNTALELATFYDLTKVDLEPEERSILRQAHAILNKIINETGAKL